MDNPKGNRYYLEKIISDLKFVITHTSGLTREEIEKNDLLVDSIMFRISQISENSSRLTDDFKGEHSSVPWLAIKGMRNRIIHDYGSVDMVVVYDVVTNGIPDMYQRLNGIEDT